MRMFRLLLLATLILGTLLGAGQTGVQAQIPIEPPPPWEPMPPVPPQPIPPATFPVTLTLHQVDAIVDGPIASVTVKQVFRNDSQSVAEGTYIFPLPTDASPSSFQMTVDGEVYEGKIYDRDEARAIYEEIVRSLRDPALLEWLDRGLFQVSAFPIPPGEERTVELTYEQPLAQEGALYRFSVPLRAYVPGASRAESVVVGVELVNQKGLRTIYSPSHPVDVTRQGDDSAVVGFEGVSKDAQSDFTLYFGTDDSVIGANLLSYMPTGEDGYFTLLVAPSLEAASGELVQRDVVLVLDVSGSMQGEKIDQAREAARYVVSQLNEGDRFNLVAFSTGVRLWEPELQEVNDATLEKADDWIRRLPATGSTNIDRALTEGLAQFGDDNARPAYLLFMTDGVPTQGETDAGRIVENALGNQPDEQTLRLFTFGVGYDVNTDLLDILSREMGGRSTYVRPEQDIEEVVAAFYDQIGKPVLANVDLEFAGDTVVDDIFPMPLPDLFAGEQLVIAGRYRDGASVEVILRGDVNGEEQTYIYPDQELVEKGGEDFVARLWATRKIGALLDQIRRDGPNDELVDAVVELSLDYGIVTPYTSFLVLEPGIVPTGGGVQEDATFAPGAALSMRDQAYDAGSVAMEAAAAAPASGEAAVASSVARQELQSAVTVEQEEQVRFVGGKTFTLHGWVEGPQGEPIQLWVDTTYEDSMETEIVPFASDRYFALAGDEQVARWLSVSPEVVVVLDDGSAIRVTSAAAIP